MAGGIKAGELYYDVVARTDRLESSVDRILRESEQAVKQSTERVAGHVQTSTRNVAQLLGSIGLGAIVSRGLKRGLDELREYDRASAAVAQHIKTTGGAANVTSEQVTKLAASLEHATGVQDSQVLSAEGVLLTFTKIRNEVGRGNDIFTRASKAAVDLSVAFDQPLKSAALQVGKALQDPISGLAALRQSGVSFTEEQREQIRVLVDTGRTLEAHRVILNAVEEQAQGTAKAAYASDPLRQYEVALKDLRKTFAEDFVPAATTALKLIGGVTDALGSNTALRHLVELGLGVGIASRGLNAFRNLTGLGNAAFRTGGVQAGALIERSMVAGGAAAAAQIRSAMLAGGAVSDPENFATDAATSPTGWRSAVSGSGIAAKAVPLIVAGVAGYIGASGLLKQYVREPVERAEEDRTARLDAVLKAARAVNTAGDPTARKILADVLLRNAPGPVSEGQLGRVFDVARSNRALDDLRTRLDKAGYSLDAITRAASPAAQALQSLNREVSLQVARREQLFGYGDQYRSQARFNGQPIVPGAANAVVDPTLDLRRQLREVQSDLAEQRADILHDRHLSPEQRRKRIGELQEKAGETASGLRDQIKAASPITTAEFLKNVFERTEATRAHAFAIDTLARKGLSKGALAAIEEQEQNRPGSAAALAKSITPNVIEALNQQIARGTEVTSALQKVLQDPAERAFVVAGEHAWNALNDSLKDKSLSLRAHLDLGEHYLPETGHGTGDRPQGDVGGRNGPTHVRTGPTFSGPITVVTPNTDSFLREIERKARLAAFGGEPGRMPA